MEGIAKLVMSALVLLMSVDMCAQKINTKEFDKYIRKYDSLEKYLATHSTDSTLSFWDTASKKNLPLKDLYAYASKKRLNEIVQFYKDASDDSYRYKDLLSLSDTLMELGIDIKKEISGGNSQKKIRNIYVYDSDEKNAFACPDGTICVASSIVYEYSFQELFGILSHEMAHFVMEHSLQKKYEDRRKEKKHKFWAAVAVAANSMASAYVQANGGVKQEDSDAYWENVQKNNDLLMNVFDYRAELSKFKYSREKEIEADIMAYRFMEFSGMDPQEYINALCKLVGFSNDRNDPDYNKKRNEFLYRYYDEDKESTHPSLAYRCCLLEHIAEYDLRKKHKK